jgi:hypothetical protein
VVAAPVHHAAIVQVAGSSSPTNQSQPKRSSELEQLIHEDAGRSSQMRLRGVNTLAAAARREAPGTQQDEMAVLAGQRIEAEQRLAELARRQAELAQRQAELAQRYTDKHPQMISLLAQISELQVDAAAQAPDTSDAYRIARADVLQISVWKNPDLGAE